MKERLIREKMISDMESMIKECEIFKRYVKKDQRYHMKTGIKTLKKIKKRIEEGCEIK